MADTEQLLAPGMQVGDYYLEEILSDGVSTRTWAAQQVSVSREVVVDSLNSDALGNDALVSAFLSDVRTKAMVDHPLIGSVFEAVREESICFYAREKISGDSLADKMMAGEQMLPKEVVHLLKQVADANLYLESHRMASMPLMPDQLYVTDVGMCRIVNMAVGGERDYNVSTQDKVMLGESLMKLLKPDQPGHTRTQSLLGFMADRGREIPLTWEQIKDLSTEVEVQLVDSMATAELQRTGVLGKARVVGGGVNFRNFGIGLGVLLLLGAFAFLIFREKPPEVRDLGGVVLVPVKDYYTARPGGVGLRDFTIDAHEVTIAEYAKFLRDISPDLVDSIKHDDEPGYKESYEPDDWDAMYKAARGGKVWRDQKMSLNCPVVGVDWWDAYAYASFYSRRLPTELEWRVVLAASGSSLKDLGVSGWGAVDQVSSDITKSKIYGLGGNVAEWCLKPSKQETDPMATKRKPVIFGGSYHDGAASGVNAGTRRWIDPSDGDKDARDLRRPYIGFRTVGQP